MISLRTNPIKAAKALLANVPTRSLAGSAAARNAVLARTNFFARTSICPRPADVLQCPPQFAAKSVVVLSTPSNLPQVIKGAIALHKAKIQVVVAGVDRVVPNGASNGVSELWLEEKVHIKRAVVTPKEPSEAVPRESDGIHAVGAKDNWKHIEGTIKMRLGRHTVEMSLANTLFATATPTTLFYFDATGDNMGQTLSELEVEVPQLEPKLAPASFADRWTGLSGGPLLHVTACTGNLIKGINGVGAAQFLEKSKPLMDLASKSTRVYAKLYSGDKMRKYEVIAGGGGWGAKADLLALSPEAKVTVGDRVEFYMITPTDRYSATTHGVASTEVSNQFLFESPLESTSYSSQASSPQTVEALFGGGSELGLTVDGVSHGSPGESVSIKFSLSRG